MDLASPSQPALSEDDRAAVVDCLLTLSNANSPFTSPLRVSRKHAGEDATPTPRRNGLCTVELTPVSRWLRSPIGSPDPCRFLSSPFSPLVHSMPSMLSPARAEMGARACGRGAHASVSAASLPGNMHAPFATPEPLARQPAGHGGQQKAAGSASTKLEFGDDKPLEHGDVVGGAAAAWAMVGLPGTDNFSLMLPSTPNSPARPLPGGEGVNGSTVARITPDTPDFVGLGKAAAGLASPSTIVGGDADLSGLVLPMSPPSALKGLRGLLGAATHVETTPGRFGAKRSSSSEDLGIGWDGLDMEDGSTDFPDVTLAMGGVCDSLIAPRGRTPCRSSRSAVQSPAAAAAATEAAASLLRRTRTRSGTAVGAGSGRGGRIRDELQEDDSSGLFELHDEQPSTAEVPPRRRKAPASHEERRPARRLTLSPTRNSRSRSAVRGSGGGGASTEKQVALDAALATDCTPSRHFPSTPAKPRKAPAAKRCTIGSAEGGKSSRGGGSKSGIKGGGKNAFKSPKGEGARASSGPEVGSGKDGGDNKRVTCRCKRSRCLKLYCDCFARELFCEDCSCEDCHNAADNPTKHFEAINAVRSRNPLAFRPKEGKATHATGCNCKKSQCLKKYCTCFEAGAPCGDKCKCNDCRNVLGDQMRKSRLAHCNIPDMAGQPQFLAQQQQEQQPQQQPQQQQPPLQQPPPQQQQQLLQFSQHVQAQVLPQQEPSPSLYISAPNGGVTPKVAVVTPENATLRQCQLGPVPTPVMTAMARPSTGQFAAVTVPAAAAAAAAPQMMAGGLVVSPEKPSSGVAYDPEGRRRVRRKILDFGEELFDEPVAVAGGGAIQLTRKTALLCMSYVGGEDLYNASLVSAAWERLAMDKSLWIEEEA